MHSSTGAVHLPPRRGPEPARPLAAEGMNRAWPEPRQHVFDAVVSGFRVVVARDAVPAMRSQRLSMQGNVAGGTWPAEPERKRDYRRRPSFSP
ncbi:hypothetical protein [Xanthobacter aminoxidans]|uniref:hypothetical protein n=1 Tax=Xanthobacter aminoxidans TaxID=186280 RepID=UPI0037280801